VNARTRWAALAVLVLAGLGLGVGWRLVLARHLDPVGPIVTRTGPKSIWPEDPFSSPDALREAQDRVNGGRDRWRRSPTAVVSRFARSIFGWDRVEFKDAARDPDVGPLTSTIRAGCASEGICAATDPRWINVTVDQLGAQRDAGVWSVIAVSSERLPLPVEAGQVVAAGDVLAFRLDLAGGEHAAVGIRYVQRLGGSTSAECPDGFEGRTDVTGTQQELTVPDPLFAEGPCAGLGAVGYVFAYITPTLTVQTGDPLLESAAITDLSIVPVLFSSTSMRSPSPAPSP
jgi:hypothetical protein